jgi:hypothetical protein
VAATLPRRKFFPYHVAANDIRREKKQEEKFFHGCMKNAILPDGAGGREQGPEMFLSWCRIAAS